MVTANEKIVAMLATIREMRKIVIKPDPIFDMIKARGRIYQKDMISLFPDMSSRSIRRHLDHLVAKGNIVRQRDGKEVFFEKNQDYPQ